LVELGVEDKLASLLPTENEVLNGDDAKDPRGIEY
jgi:hypothetical protein